METKKLYCRLNGFISGSENELKKFLNGDINANVKFIVAKEGYIPSDVIEDFYNEVDNKFEAWWADDLDFSVNDIEYSLD